MDAVHVEYVLGSFLGGEVGKRGEMWDADTIRGGIPKSMAKLLDAVAKRIAERAAHIPNFSGSPGSDIVRQATDHLNQLAEQVRSGGGKATGETYHWEAIADLVWVVDGLLKHAGV